MLVNERIEFIVDWIKGYSDKVKFNPVSLIIGVSGGVDSAVASTLSAKTKLKTIAVSMPIRQNSEQHNLSLQHLEWLKSKYNNVETKIIELDHVFNSFEKEMSEYENKLAFANSRSRLRMITLYQIAQSSNGIVVGTGNKVEDFGVGFYTKYGDGGVDVSPIADCTKSQVWEMAKELEINNDIVNAHPQMVCGMIENDESQLGLTYKEIEEAMENKDSPHFEKYNKIREQNLHKMISIPVCKFEK